MIFEFSQFIQEVETEIGHEYLPGVIQWADENRDGAWSYAIDQFEKALIASRDHRNWEVLKQEANLYKKRCLDLIREYKDMHSFDEQDRFIKSLHQRKASAQMKNMSQSSSLSNDSLTVSQNDNSSNLAGGQKDDSNFVFSAH